MRRTLWTSIVVLISISILLSNVEAKKKKKKKQLEIEDQSDKNSRSGAKNETETSDTKTPKSKSKKGCSDDKDCVVDTICVNGKCVSVKCKSEEVCHKLGTKGKKRKCGKSGFCTRKKNKNAVRLSRYV